MGLRAYIDDADLLKALEPFGENKRRSDPSKIQSRPRSSWLGKWKPTSANGAQYPLYPLLTEDRRRMV